MHWMCIVIFSLLFKESVFNYALSSGMLDIEVSIFHIYRTINLPCPVQRREGIW